MFVNNSTFDNAMYLLNKGLNAESLRFNVLNNNVVNANTPNFKRSDVTFEGELQRA